MEFQIQGVAIPSIEAVTSSSSEDDEENPTTGSIKQDKMAIACHNSVENDVNNNGSPMTTRTMKQRIRFVLVGIFEFVVLTILCAGLNVVWWLLGGCATRWCFVAFHVSTLFVLELLLLLGIVVYRNVEQYYEGGCKTKTGNNAHSDFNNNVNNINMSNTMEEDYECQEDCGITKQDSVPKEQPLSFQANDEETATSIKSESKNRLENMNESPEQLFTSHHHEIKRNAKVVYDYVKDLRPDTVRVIVVMLLTLVACQIILIFFLPTAVIVSDSKGNLGKASISLWHPTESNLLTNRSILYKNNHNGGGGGDFGLPYNPPNTWNDLQDNHWYQHCNFTHLILYAQTKYGNCIDFSKLRLVYGGIPRYFAPGLSMCLDNTIFFTHCPGRHLMLHELAHAWQFQNDIFFYGRQGPGNLWRWFQGQSSGNQTAYYDPYPAIYNAYYTAMKTGQAPPPFEQVLNAEQMADLIADGMTTDPESMSEAHVYYFDQMLGGCLHTTNKE